MVQDLILVLNSYDCYEYKKPVIELFRCTNKLLKDKSFSGPLYPFYADKNSPPENISESDFNLVREVLEQATPVKSSGNKYVITEKNLIELVHSLYRRKIFYYRKEKRGRIYLIEFFANRIKPISLTISSKFTSNFSNEMKLGIELDQEKYHFLPKQAAFFCFDEYNFLVMNNEMFFVSQWVDSQFINTAISNKLKISNKMIKANLNSLEIIKDELRFNKDAGNYSVVSDFRIVPCIYLSNKNSKWYGKLRFRYGDAELEGEFGLSNDFIIDSYNKIRVKRNLELELSFVEYLKSQGWLVRPQEHFVYAGTNFTRMLQQLLDKDWKVFSEKLERVRKASTPRITVSSNIDWFDLKINPENEPNLPLSELLMSLKKERPWVELKDGTRVLIPDSIFQNRQMFINAEIEGNVIRVSKKFAGLLKSLSAELGLDQQSAIETAMDFSKTKLSLSPNFKGVLRQYQIQGVKWLKYLFVNGFGGCLADDMGLGKTIQVIALLSEHDIQRDPGVSLVVVPKTLLFNWQREILKFNSNLRLDIYHGDNREEVIKKVVAGKLDIVLTTYGTLRNDVKRFCSITLKYLILDEAQVIKNFQSKTYTEINTIEARNRLVMTGTPIENNISELWGLMEFLNPGLFGKYQSFENTYSGLDDESLRRLNGVISPFVLRRTKQEVLNDLPDKVEQDIYCEMEPDQKDLYELVRLKVRKEVEYEAFNPVSAGSKVLEGLLYLRQICCDPRLLRQEFNIVNCQHSGKFECLKELLAEIRHNRNKVLVFSQFTSMLKLIEGWIVEQGWEYYYLDGETRNRQSIVDEFENSSAPSIFLLSLKAGGVGLNLVSANHVILFDPWWNPAVESQAIDRVFRIGQRKNVNVYRLITSNSIEEKIQKLKAQKTEVSSLILENQDIVRNFSLTDLKKLLDN